MSSTQPPDTSGADATNPDVDVQDDAVIGRAFFASLAVIVLVGAAVGGAVWWHYRSVEPILSLPVAIEPPRVREVSRREPPIARFTNITQSAGIKFVHVNGAEGEKLLPETMGGGCAFFDFDDDGDQDLLLVNSTHWPWRKSKPDGPSPTQTLYENDGRGQFRDVTAGSGLDVTLYGMGVAVGDYDNDGRVDVFISAVGANRLFRNQGQGKFLDVTTTAGVAAEADAWSTGCGFFDYDRDGDLDLFVCNYIRWSREIDLAQAFVLTGIVRAYGPPRSFGGTFPYLYRNDGNGKFSDVSAASGVRVVHPQTGVPVAKSLGLSLVDVDRDGWIDIVVANDTVQNFLFHNQRNGSFKEIGANAGIAFDPNGNARGAMGIDAGRFRNDDCLGIAIGNFANEMSALYVTRGHHARFTDEAIATGFGPATRGDLKFGTMFVDYDLDGRLDLLSANGHLEEEINQVQASQHYRQPARMFWNAGADQPTEFFAVKPDRIGTDLSTPIVGRGAAYADIDNDGDLDLLLTQIAGPPLLLRNEHSAGHHFVRLKLVGTRANRDAIGAWIEVIAGGQRLARQVMPTRSYLSQVELPITIGLGAATSIEKVTITWPDGSESTVPPPKLDTTTVVTQPSST